jgi:hypothetical protein
MRQTSQNGLVWDEIEGGKQVVLTRENQNLQKTKLFRASLI